ncbi:hypothetical protein VCV18_003882 [Metarhizium anisopliae]
MTKSMRSDITFASLKVVCPGGGLRQIGGIECLENPWDSSSVDLPSKEQNFIQCTAPQSRNQEVMLHQA